VLVRSERRQRCPAPCSSRGGGSFLYGRRGQWRRGIGGGPRRGAAASGRQTLWRHRGCDLGTAAWTGRQPQGSIEVAALRCRGRGLGAAVTGQWPGWVTEADAAQTGWATGADEAQPGRATGADPATDGSGFGVRREGADDSHLRLGVLLRGSGRGEQI
jgi:hypothetical protein